MTWGFILVGNTANCQCWGANNYQLPIIIITQLHASLYWSNTSFKLLGDSEKITPTGKWW